MFYYGRKKCKTGQLASMSQSWCYYSPSCRLLTDRLSQFFDRETQQYIYNKDVVKDPVTLLNVLLA